MAVKLKRGRERGYRKESRVEKRAGDLQRRVEIGRVEFIHE